jgi:hypothetical protein
VTHPGLATFAEFYATASRQQLVGTGSVPRLEALFDLYDAEGTGLLRYTWFADAILGVIPNPFENPNIRTALSLVRRALAAEGGGLALAAAGAALKKLSTTIGQDLVPRRDAQRILVGCSPKLSSWNLKEVLAECCRPHSPGGAFTNSTEGVLKISELHAMLRGRISRPRRKAIDNAWGTLDPDSAGIVSRSAVEHCIGETASSLLVSKDGLVSYENFVMLYRDISAMIEDDSDFLESLKSSFTIPVSSTTNTGNVIGAPSSRPQIVPLLPLSSRLIVPRTVSREERAAALAGATSYRSTDSSSSSSSSSSFSSGVTSSRGISSREGAEGEGGVLRGSAIDTFRKLATGRVPIPFSGAPHPEIPTVGMCLQNTLQRNVPLTGKEWFLGEQKKVVSMPIKPEPFGAGSPRAFKLGATLLSGGTAPNYTLEPIPKRPVSAQPLGIKGMAMKLTDTVINSAPREGPSLTVAGGGLLSETRGGQAAAAYLASIGRKGQPQFRFNGPTNPFY